MDSTPLKLNLANKISLLAIVAILLVLTVLGVYFDAFLKASFLDTTEKRIVHGYQRLQYNLENIETELKDGLAFIRTAEGMIASIELINNYQDKQNYNVYLLDEEKKLIAEELLNRVKLSFNSDISLYDQNHELIAYVTMKDGLYEQNFLSYQNGRRQRFSRMETDALYQPSEAMLESGIPFDHTAIFETEQIRGGVAITYHLIDGEIVIKSHHSIFDENSERVLAHIEMAKTLDGGYFSRLSSDLDISLTYVTDERYAEFAQPLDKSVLVNRPNITQSEHEYLSVTVLPTQDGPVYLVAKLDKLTLRSVLNSNRIQFLFLLVVVATVMLVLMRFAINHGLTYPLSALMRQIEKIEKQDYSRSNLVRTGDEIETISSNVNNLAETVQEREHSLRLSQQELEYLSNHDPLTDLPNRRFFSRRLEHALKLAKRTHSQLAIFFLDLDQFKLVNDTLGHDVGDELLKVVSCRLAESLREIDTLSRIGGDEFIILIENVGDLYELEVIVKKLLRQFDTPFQLGRHEIYSTASIGIALYPKDGDDSVTLVKHADLAMYKSKDNGRNSFSFFYDELSHSLQERADKTRALKLSIEKGTDFELLYQPKIDVASRTIAGVEALIRWNSKEYGYVMPDQFIPLAEETGLIIPIGRWVLEQACRDFVLLEQSGVSLGHVAINLSSVQLQHSDMLATLNQVIALSGIRPEQIELEITESYIATDVNEAIQTLQRLRDMGIQLAIDDFGTGYSSMSYLKQIPVTRLKIDKSFIDDLPENKENIAIVRAIIALAKTFEVSSTAEGVETEAQCQFLRKEQCDEIQGYFYAKPLTLEELKRFSVASLKTA